MRNETEQRGGAGDDVSPASLARLSVLVHERAVKEHDDLVRLIRVKKDELKALKRMLEKAGEKRDWAAKQRKNIEQDPLL